MKRFFLAIFGLFILWQLSLSMATAQELLRWGTITARNPYYGLTFTVAEEKGFWKSAGLKVDWRPFRGSRLIYKGLTAGSLDVGISTIISVIPSIARGVPIIVAADLQSKQDFIVWVKPDSPIKEPTDLKGKTLGITRLGGATHAYSKVLLRSLGLEDQVKVVGSGGIRPAVAAFRSGKVDAIIYPINTVATLVSKGHARQLVAIGKYLPKDKVNIVIYPRTSVVENKPQAVKKAIGVVLKSLNYVLENRDWSLEKMKTISKYNRKEAEMVFASMGAGKDGKINKKGVMNALDFLVEFGVIKEDKAPPLNKIYTTQFTGEM